MLFESWLSKRSTTEEVISEEVIKIFILPDAISKSEITEQDFRLLSVFGVEEKIVLGVRARECNLQRSEFSLEYGQVV